MPQENTDLSNRTFLLGVGAHKAGTTWLHDYLNNHPDVFMSPIKEMHFFGNRFKPENAWPYTHFRRRLRDRKAQFGEKGKTCTALRARLRMGGNMKAYRRFFRWRVGAAPVFGEITPAYAILDIKELQYARSRFDRIRVIFLMRNPVDRLWSHMRFSEKYDTLDELESQLGNVLSKPAYRQRINYAQTLQNLQQVFTPDELHVEFYEHLFTDAAIQRLCAFLGIDDRPANFKKRLNVSMKLPLSPLLRPNVVADLRDQYEFVIAQFGANTPQSWHDDLALLA